MRQFLALALALLAAPAAADDVAEGRALAERWCAECHQIAPDAPASDIGPSFVGLAPEVEETEEALRAWLFAPHEPMPDMDLAPAQITDLLAYIATLEGEDS